MVMNNCGRIDVFVLGLVLLLAAQLSFLATRLARQQTSPVPWLEVGDTLRGIQAVYSVGAEVPVVDGEPTVLLVFRSDCGYCEEIAPVWRRWIEGNAGRRVIAVTSEPWGTAKGFVSRHRLKVESVTVEDRSVQAWADLCPHSPNTMGVLPGFGGCDSGPGTWGPTE